VQLTIEPGSPQRWADVRAVFGARGEPSRCWCVYLRQAQVSYKADCRSANRATLERAIGSGTPAGLLAYREGTPVGWVSAGPRDQFAARLSRSPALAPAPFDGGEIWSVLCFVVPRAHRGQGVTTALLAGAVEHARAAGAAAIEGVPRDDRGGKRWPAPMAYTGMATMFERAGFRAVEPRRDERVLYRLLL
jgi:GNAT superfamily N-acetyltransferase